MARTLPTPIHVCPAYASCGCSPYVATFLKPPHRWMDPTTPEKKGSWHNPQPGWVIYRSTTQLLSQHSHWSSNESQTSVDGRLLGLPDSYHRHAISTFNTCSRGPSHRSLTDTGRGYNLVGAGLPIPLPDLPNRRSYTFHLIAPPGLRLSIINIILYQILRVEP
jgi:hypothetical protein